MARKSKSNDAGIQSIDPKNVFGSGTAETGGVETGGVETSGVETGGVETSGVETGGVETGAVETGGVKTSAIEGAEHRKRGRPKGSKNRSKDDSSASSVSVNVDGISAILLSLHAMASSYFKMPELAIDERESKAIADATANVLRFYPIAASAKTLAIANLAMVCSAVYGPRVYAVMTRKTQHKATVTPIHA